MKMLKTINVVLISCSIYINACNKLNPSHIHSHIHNDPIINDAQHTKLGYGYKSLIGINTNTICMTNDNIIEETYTKNNNPIFNNKITIHKINNKTEFLQHIFKSDDTQSLKGMDLFLATQNKDILLYKSKLLKWINNINMHKWSNYYLITIKKLTKKLSLKDTKLSDTSTKLLNLNINNILKNSKANTLNTDKSFYNACGNTFISEIYYGLINYFVLEIPKIYTSYNTQSISNTDIWLEKLRSYPFDETVNTIDSNLYKMEKDYFVQNYYLETLQQNRVVKLYKFTLLGIDLETEENIILGQLGSFGINADNTYSGRIDLSLFLEYISHFVKTYNNEAITVEPVIIATKHTSYESYITDFVSHNTNFNIINQPDLISNLINPPKQQLDMINNKNFYDSTIKIQQLINNLQYATGSAPDAYMMQKDKTEKVWKNFIPWATKYYKKTWNTDEELYAIHEDFRYTVIFDINNNLIPQFNELSNLAYECLHKNNCYYPIKIQASTKYPYEDIYMFFSQTN